MKQVTFISGKGGTGKSTLVSSLNILIDKKMTADCDVESPNLHLLTKGELLEKNDFYGMKKAFIDKGKCTECGLCRKSCRFEAITEDFKVENMKCEGCGACVVTCPKGAVELNKVKSGKTIVSDTSKGIFSHAQLDIGAEGSGKLVTEVREYADKYKTDEEWLFIDGSPGIGCVVIASITGTDAVVAVTEPTKSGLSDLERILKTAEHFGIKSFVCINKYDLNEAITAEIEQYCSNNDIPIIGKIPFDPRIVKALQQLKTPVEDNNTLVTAEIENLWEKLKHEV